MLRHGHDLPGSPTPRLRAILFDDQVDGRAIGLAIFIDGCDFHVAYSSDKILQSAHQVLGEDTQATFSWRVCTDKSDIVLHGPEILQHIESHA